MTEDEVVGWHHRLNGHEFKQTLGGSEVHKSLACCSSLGHRVKLTYRINKNSVYKGVN